MSDYGEYDVDGYDWFVPTGISYDGKDVVGYAKVSGSRNEDVDGLWYKPNGKVKTIIRPAVRNRSEPYVPYGINSDATYACGAVRLDGPTHGFIFRKSTEELNTFKYSSDYDHTRALGINKDNIIVGELFKPIESSRSVPEKAGFIWTDTGGFTVLQCPWANYYTRFTAINDDNVVTGTADGWQVFNYYIDTNTWESIIPGPEIVHNKDSVILSANATPVRGDFEDDEFISNNILRDISMNKQISGIQKGIVRYNNGDTEVVSVPGQENAEHTVGAINGNRTVCGMRNNNGSYASFFKTEPQEEGFNIQMMNMYAGYNKSLFVYFVGMTNTIDELDLESGIEIPVDITLDFNVPPFILNNSKRLVLKGNSVIRIAGEGKVEAFSSSMIKKNEK